MDLICSVGITVYSVSFSCSVPLYLVLLLLGQLHLLPLLLHLRGGQLLLLLVGRQELLPQAAQLANHAHELALFLRQAVCGTYRVRERRGGGRERGQR